MASTTGPRVNSKLVGEKMTVPPAANTPGNGDHMRNWIECLRSRRTPNASVLTGYYHSVVCIMGHQSAYLGKRLYWDARNERIVEERPAA